MTTTVYGGTLDGNTMRAVGPLSIDLSNRNFVIAMDALGIVADACGHMDIDQFLGLARQWLQRNINKPSAMVASREHRGDLGCTVIDLPLRAGYVNERIHQIVTMLASAKEQGATYVYWG